MLKNRKKWVAFAAAGLLCLLCLVGFAFWQMISAPLYQPGKLSQRGDLSPATRDSSGPWQVAPEIALSHQQQGHGRPILFIHGGPGRPFEGSIPGFKSLEDRYTIYNYHQRGCGKSSRPLGSYQWGDSTWDNIQKLERTLGISQQLADIERIRQILGQEKLILVGHSYGALLAALYAAEMPQRVESLVLLTPADLLVFPSEFGGLFDNIEEKLPKAQKQGFASWKERYFDMTGIFALSTAELRELEQGFLPFYEAVMGKTPKALHTPDSYLGPWHIRAQYFSMGMKHDWRDFLARIGAPTLVIHAEKDFQPQGVAEMYQESIPQAQLEVIAGAGHTPHFSHPQAFAEALQSLFSP